MGTGLGRPRATTLSYNNDFSYATSGADPSPNFETDFKNADPELYSLKFTRCRFFSMWIWISDSTK